MMSLGFRLACLLLCVILQAATVLSGTQIPQQANKIPLTFTENVGQWDERILFRASAGGATMWFTRDGVIYQFTRNVGRGTQRAPAGLGAPGSPLAYAMRPYDPDVRDSIEQLVLTAKFVGANPSPEIIAERLMEYKCNYFLGDDPSKWYTDVPNYQAITLRNIYPGIDVRYSGDGDGQAAYEFTVAPGADIGQIKVEYEGAETTSIAADGRLILTTKWGKMTAAMRSPADGVLSGNASCAWWTSSSATSRPDLPQGNVRQALAEMSGSLTLSYSTYLGGNGDDWGCGIAVDGGGNAYVTGYTYSVYFPTGNPYQTDQGGIDVFVTKLSNTGNSLVYSTYLGGEHSDYGIGIAVDGSGNAYVTGYTFSTHFPSLNPYQTDQAGYDAFVTKLSSTGNSLVYSTYLGGEGEDVGRGIAVDASGNAYVTGTTASLSFPTQNPYQTAYRGGFSDGFVTKLSGSGSSLIYSTYLGGSSGDAAYGIALNGSGNAYVTGATGSSNFPTLNAYQSTFQGADEYYGGDAFVVSFSASGDNLIYGTYLGGDEGDYGFGIAVDGNDNAYVTGMTSSPDFPSLNAYQGTFQGGSSDAFVTKVSRTGSSLLYSTYLGGGAGWEEGRSITLDGNGSAYVSGTTASADFPTVNAYDATFNGGTWDGDAFVTKLSGSGSRLIYSTYLGGASDDYGKGIVVDAGGNPFVTGHTASPDFPVLNPYQTDQGGMGAFITRLSACASDADCDGVADGIDNCPSEPNPGQQDADSDGRGDACDNCPTIYNVNQADTDGDEIGNVCDDCPEDILNDIDGDGLCGNVDNCPKVSNPGQQDSDSDGSGDACDNCPNISNANQADTDGDGIGNVCDACPADSLNDVDGDGYCGNVDNCPSISNSNQQDTDSDGIGDVCDHCPLDSLNDVDRDGVCGDVDSCPLDSLNDADGDGFCSNVDNCPTKSNPGQQDSDCDGSGDACDNCPTTSNSDQADTDGDGIGNVCDACPLDSLNDIDEDGVCGDVDKCPNNPDPEQEDRDRDGRGDACDNCLTTANPDQLDTDGDRIGDACDACPLDSLNDVDKDGVCGNVDNCPNLWNSSQQDTDSDAVGDSCDNCPTKSNPTQIDSDQDGIGDACEFICGDANGDAVVDISDVVYLIAYIFSGGKAPSPLLAGDANCDLMVDISDVVYLIAYIFAGGQAPCARCR
jgi:hypothetical protein